MDNFFSAAGSAMSGAAVPIFGLLAAALVISWAIAVSRVASGQKSDDDE